MNIWEADKLLLFIGFVIPGFISLKAYELLVPGPAKDSSKQIIDAVAYSSVNYALLIGTILWVENAHIHAAHPALYIAFYVFVLLIAPVLWAIAWRTLRSAQWLQDNAPHPVQKPWDYVFARRIPYWVRVTLKDGTKLGGRFADQSFASSASAEEQIYLEEAWILNDDGTLARPKQQSAGLLVMGRDIAYLELMSYYGADEDEQQQDEPPDPDQKGLSA